MATTDLKIDQSMFICGSRADKDCQKKILETSLSWSFAEDIFDASFITTPFFIQLNKKWGDLKTIVIHKHFYFELLAFLYRWFARVPQYLKPDCCQNMIQGYNIFKI